MILVAELATEPPGVTIVTVATPVEPGTVLTVLEVSAIETGMSVL